MGSLTSKPDDALAWGSEVAVLQSNYSVSFSFQFSDADWPMLMMLWGDPQAVLWWRMGALYKDGWIWADE